MSCSVQSNNHFIAALVSTSYLSINRFLTAIPEILNVANSDIWVLKVILRICIFLVSWLHCCSKVARAFSIWNLCFFRIGMNSSTFKSPASTALKLWPTHWLLWKRLNFLYASESLYFQIFRRRHLKPFFRCEDVISHIQLVEIHVKLGSICFYIFSICRWLRRFSCSNHNVIHRLLRRLSECEELV